MPATKLPRWQSIGEIGRLGQWVSRHHTRTCAISRSQPIGVATESGGA
jgi:hypothetical protein